MTTSQTATGHQSAVSSRDVGLSDLRRRLLGTIIRRFARDHHVVDVAFTQPGPADSHKAGVLLQLLNRGAANIAHAALHAADELIRDHADRPTVWHAPLDAFGNELGQAVSLGAVVGQD